MSPQKEGESLELYLYRLETTQERHEDEIARTNKAVEAAMSVAVQAKEMAVQTSSMIETMPQRVIDAIEKKRDRARDWMIALVGVAGTVSGILVGLFK